MIKKYHEAMAAVGCGVAAIALLVAASLFNGCGKSNPQVFSKPPEVPVTSITPTPNKLILRPGQSAVLLQDVAGIARIPAQGDGLYEGPVVLQKGTVVIKPISE